MQTKIELAHAFLKHLKFHLLQHIYFLNTYICTEYADLVVKGVGWSQIFSCKQIA